MAQQLRDHLNRENLRVLPPHHLVPRHHPAPAVRDPGTTSTSRRTSSTPCMGSAGCWGSSLVENRLLGVAGDCLMFPGGAQLPNLHPTYELGQPEESGSAATAFASLWEHFDTEADERIAFRLTCPPPDVFAEAVRGACNVCERIERHAVPALGAVPHRRAHRHQPRQHGQPLPGAAGHQALAAGAAGGQHPERAGRSGSHGRGGAADGARTGQPVRQHHRAGSEPEERAGGDDVQPGGRQVLPPDGHRAGHGGPEQPQRRQPEQSNRQGLPAQQEPGEEPGVEGAGALGASSAAAHSWGRRSPRSAGGPDGDHRRRPPEPGHGGQRRRVSVEVRNGAEGRQRRAAPRAPAETRRGPAARAHSPSPSPPRGRPSRATPRRGADSAAVRNHRDFGRLPGAGHRPFCDRTRRITCAGESVRRQPDDMDGWCGIQVRDPSDTTLPVGTGCPCIRCRGSCRGSIPTSTCGSPSTWRWAG